MSAATRFAKGKSGNPKGRPRKPPPAPISAFDIVIDRTLTITQNGQPREVTIDEALQHRTYQEALAGSRPARREILRMIAKREKALAANFVPPTGVEVRHEREDPTNAEQALCILGIASPAPESEFQRDGLLLEPWAVQAALSRRRKLDLTMSDVTDIKRSVRDAGSLRGLYATAGR